MLSDGVRIIRQIEDARFGQDGKHTPIIRVEFMIGDHGPFIERFPKADYTAATRDERLMTFAREILG